MKRALMGLVLSVSAFFAFGITPVFAEEWYPELWQYDSINLFTRSGGVWNVQDKNLSLNTSGSSSYTELLHLYATVWDGINDGDMSPIAFTGTYQDREGWFSCVTSNGGNTYNCYPYDNPNGTTNGSFTFKPSTPIRITADASGSTNRITGTAMYNLTTVYVDKFNMFMPIMNTSNVLHGDYSFKWEGKHIYLTAGKYYVSFISLDNDKNGRQHNAKIYGSQGGIISSTHKELINISGAIHITLTFDVTVSDNYNFVFDNQVNNIVPLYFGTADYISDDISVLIGMPSTTNQLLSNMTVGNNQTQSVVNESNNINQQYQAIESQVDTLQQSSNADLTLRLSSLPTSSNLLSLPKLVASANWVRDKFNLLNVAPFSVILEFSLILGIALIFIGKIR